MAKEFLPNRLQAVQDEYDNHVTKSQGMNAASLMSQARSWELQSEFARAVDCYFKVSLRGSHPFDRPNRFDPPTSGACVFYSKPLHESDQLTLLDQPN